jgi:hypothetical protein
LSFSGVAAVFEGLGEGEEGARDHLIQRPVSANPYAGSRLRRPGGECAALLESHVLSLVLRENTGSRTGVYSCKGRVPPTAGLMQKWKES